MAGFGRDVAGVPWGASSLVFPRGPPVQLVWARQEAALNEQYTFSFSRDLIQINSNKVQNLLKFIVNQINLIKL
jgi:hypothetical protein